MLSVSHASNLNCLRIALTESNVQQVKLNTAEQCGYCFNMSDLIETEEGISLTLVRKTKNTPCGNMLFTHFHMPALHQISSVQFSLVQFSAVQCSAVGMDILHK